MRCSRRYKAQPPVGHQAPGEEDSSTQNAPPMQHERGQGVDTGSRIAFSGSNAVDGVGVQEGRILFATTTRADGYPHRVQAGKLKPGGEPLKVLLYAGRADDAEIEESSVDQGYDSTCGSMGGDGNHREIFSTKVSALAPLLFHLIIIETSSLTSRDTHTCSAFCRYDP